MSYVFSKKSYLYILEKWNSYISGNKTFQPQSSYIFGGNFPGSKKILLDELLKISNKAKRIILQHTHNYYEFKDFFVFISNEYHPFTVLCFPCRK